MNPTGALFNQLFCHILVLFVELILYFSFNGLSEKE